MISSQRQCAMHSIVKSIELDVNTHLWIRFAGLRALHLEDLGRFAIYSSAAPLCALS